MIIQNIIKTEENTLFHFNFAFVFWDKSCLRIQCTNHNLAAFKSNQDYCKRHLHGPNERNEAFSEELNS